MSEINDGGPAFPQMAKLWKDEYGSFDPAYSDGGVSVRDYFAAKAMQAFLTASFTEYGAKKVSGVMDKSKLTAEEVATKFAFQYADAMLKAREAQ